MNDKISLYPSGVGTEKSSFFEKLRESKAGSTIAMSVAFFAMTNLLPMKNAQAAPVKAKMTYEEIYNSDEQGYEWKTNGDNFGVSHPEMESENAAKFITNKINSDGSVDRYYIGNNDLILKVASAKTYNLEFKNPFSGKKEYLKVLIAKDNTQKQVEVLLAGLKMVAESKINYPIITKTSPSHGDFIYTANMHLGSKYKNQNIAGLYGAVSGVISIDIEDVLDVMKKSGKKFNPESQEVFEVSSTLAHEIKHGDRKFGQPMPKSVQFEEAEVRSHTAMYEYEKINANPKKFKYTFDSKILATIYNVNKKLRLSEKNLQTILVLAALHANTVAAKYDTDNKQFSELQKDIEITGLGGLSALKQSDMKKFNFNLGDENEIGLRVGEIIRNHKIHVEAGKNTDNYPDLIVPVVNMDNGQTVDLNVDHILNPDKSGVKQLEPKPLFVSNKDKSKTDTSAENSDSKLMMVQNFLKGMFK